MKMIYRMRLSALCHLSLLLCLLGLMERVAGAQFATVKGTIQTLQKVKVPGAKILVFDSKSHKRIRDPQEARFNGDYMIDDLLPGTYDFVACGSPYGPDKRKGKAVKQNESLAIDFFLQTPPDGVSRVINGRNLPANSDGFVYMKDHETGCTVAQFAKMPNGDYKITNLVPGYDLCTRIRGGDEVYQCSSID